MLSRHSTNIITNTPQVDAFDPNDISHEDADSSEVGNSMRNDNGEDSDSPHQGRPRQPVHYAYDAVADSERTQHR